MVESLVTPAERTRLTLCRLAAFLAPLATLLICFGMFAGAELLDLPLPGLSPWAMFVGNAVPGAMASAAAMLLLHPMPDPRRRFRAAVGWLVLSPVLYFGTFGLLIAAVAASEWS